jgi:dihydroorotase-like cyclic amidohydrolase
MSSLTILRDVTHWRTGERLTLAVEDGIVVPVPRTIPEHARVVEGHGAVIAPGLVDLHVHLREPGQSAKETIESGTRAAAAGGFTAIACMPNTDPVVDTAAWVEWVRRRAEAAGHCTVLPIAAVTVGQKGEQLAPLDALGARGRGGVLGRRSSDRECRGHAPSARVCARDRAADHRSRGGPDAQGRRRHERGLHRDATGPARAAGRGRERHVPP